MDTLLVHCEIIWKLETKAKSSLSEKCTFYKCCRNYYANLTTEKQLKPLYKNKKITWVYSPYPGHTVPMYYLLDIKSNKCYWLFL